MAEVLPKTPSWPFASASRITASGISASASRSDVIVSRSEWFSRRSSKRTQSEEMLWAAEDGSDELRGRSRGARRRSHALERLRFEGLVRPPAGEGPEGHNAAARLRGPRGPLPRRAHPAPTHQS